MVDIFEFWSKIGRGEKIHPADRSAFARMDAKRHGFRLDCLPAAFGGRLRDAPIVLLYLSPGFSQADLAAAKTNEGKDFYVRRWQGYEPAATSWTRSPTKNFGDWEIVRQKVAVLNIGAYHSTNVRSYASLLALPSSRVSMEWAQGVLFPEAEAGRRIVICMRSAPYWGLDPGRRYGKCLFAPRVNRSRYLIKDDDNQRLIKLVRARIDPKRQ
jgi:hypothetical protein